MVEGLLLSLLVAGGLFELVLVSLMVTVGLCKSECRSVDVSDVGVGGW